LTILNLQGNLLNFQDLAHLQTFENLIKLNLSHNKLKALPASTVFAGLRNLKFLYLHNNGISTWDDIQLLTALPTIMHITLMNNPVSAILGYRYFLARSV